MPAMPLAPPREEIRHIPTLELINALIDADWRAYRIGADFADLRHPSAELPIRVTMQIDDTSRLSEVFIGERQVSFRTAIEYARARH